MAGQPQVRPLQGGRGGGGVGRGERVVLGRRRGGRGWGCQRLPSLDPEPPRWAAQPDTVLLESLLAK